MFLANKIGWAGVAFTFLATGMLGQGFAPGAAGSASNKPGVAVFVTKNEIKKVQETLQVKGCYGGKVDGVFGLRTRASVRAYQKAENLPVTGQVDSRTAAGLGVRPESTWDISQSAERLGRSSDVVSGAFIGGKPSAGIKRAKGRQGKTARKEVSGATMIGDNRGSGGNKQQAEHEEDDQ